MDIELLIEHKLNELGKDGWEPYALHADEDFLVFFLKRYVP